MTSLPKTALAGINGEAKKMGLVTEQGMALVCLRYMHEFIRYDRDRGFWLRWTGKHWAERMDHEIRECLYEACRAVVATMKGLKPPDIKRVTSEHFAAKLEKIMQTSPHVSVTSDIWDADPWLLGTPDGTIDLKTGLMIPPNPDDHISRLTLVTPAAPGTPTPMFDKFFDESTVGDRSVQDFLMVWFGISATGTVTEQRLVFIHGPGGNGKGVLLRTVSLLLGPSAVAADPKLFIAKRNEAHPTGLARLQGARMVIGVEVPKGSSWDSEVVKMLTGGDAITARFMNKNFFTFRPRATITVSGNPKPSLDSTDNAIRRRLLLVPFLYVLPKDKVIGDLEDKLIAAEGPGILRKIIDGAVAWYAAGCKLAVPKTIENASNEYIDSEDAIAAFIEQECELGAGFETSSADLYLRFVEFQRDRGGKTGAINQFVSDMAQVPGLERKKRMDFRGFLGIKLKHLYGDIP